MAMKRTELEKRAGLRVAHEMKHRAGRLGQSAKADPHADANRRARRAADRAAGLIPFAIKLPAELVARLRAAAQARGVAPEMLVTRWLEESLRDR